MHIFGYKKLLPYCFSCGVFFASQLNAGAGEEEGHLKMDIDVKSVLLIGATGGRGQLYMGCMDARDDMQVTGIVKGRREPDLSGLVHDRPVVYSSLEDALSGNSYSLAVVSVPHSEHDAITRALIDAEISLIIKEKPLAWRASDALAYRELTDGHDITIMTTTQRMVMPTFQRGIELLPRVGTPLSFEYNYHFALPEMTSGWRANQEKAFGGVLLDMGSHALNYLNSLFGRATEVESEFSYRYPEMAEQNLEDRAIVRIFYGDMHGTLSINRHAEMKEEELLIHGTDGALKISGKETVLYDRDGQVVEHITATLSKKELIHKLFDRAQDPGQTAADWRKAEFERNLETTQTIERIYQTHTVVEW